MFANYFKIAFRNLWKQKWLSLINISGLSIGLACFTLFMLYALNEFTYDRFHQDNAQLYRIYRWAEGAEGVDGDPYTPIPLAPALKADFSDVLAAVRMRESWGKSFVRSNGSVANAAVSFADPQFFDIFHFPVKYGNQGAALQQTDDLVITEKTALRLFGEANVIGRTLEIKLGETFLPFRISAVVTDIPSNSSITFEILGHFDRLRALPRMEKRWTNWNHSGYFTYVKLQPGSSLSNDDQRWAQFRHKYYPDEAAELAKKGNNEKIGYRLQSIRDMHTQSDVVGGVVATVKPSNIWRLVAIAAGVLLIACINFTTLAIGRSAGRAREVGVRKVMGSNRNMLAGQFLSESVLMTGISAALGLGLVYLLLPAFNQLADRELVFSFRQFPEMGWMLAGLVLLTGVLAGSYPALVLSGLRPIETLRSKIKLGGSNLFTKSLVVGQFVLSISLLAATIIIVQQANYLRSKNPGFDKENVLVVDADGAPSERIYPLFKQELATRPEIKGIAGAETSLGEGMGWSRSGWDEGDKHREVYEYYVDRDFLSVLQLELLSGRNFDINIPADTLSSVIINETMMRTFGWTPETALNQELKGYYEDPQKALPRVIGVVKDFNYKSFKEEIAPQMFHQFSGYVPYKYLVRIEAGQTEKAIRSAQAVWSSIEAEMPFQYSFLDDDLDRFYKAEVRLGNIISWAGGISIFLACLGLFGLSALAVANRLKEIGIRKVLGASVSGIIGLVARDFVKLVYVAILIAVPLSYYFMEKWLADFVYRIKMEWWMFAIAGVGAIAIAFLTISYQGIKAALVNPVKSLRND